MIEIVPNEFKVLTNHEYPPYNRTIFEEFFMYYYDMKIIDSIYTYLPIMWTNLYISRNYSNGDMSDLQRYLNSLDRNKKYFTIIQYDDGILENIEDLIIQKCFEITGKENKILLDIAKGEDISFIRQKYGDF